MKSLVLLLISVVVVCNGYPHDPSSDWRVVGGETAIVGDDPFMTSLRYSDGSNFHFCGGFIIARRTVLTAGHCVQFLKPKDMEIVVGTNKLNTGGTRYPAEAIKLYPGFVSWYYGDDLALVYTSTTIQMNDLVQPIAISTENIGGGLPVKLSGWGSKEVGEPSPNDLQTIELRTLDHQECKNRTSEITTIDEKSMCTLTKYGEGACHGDSGSPLRYKGEAVGIVSWGFPCARGEPDVYLKIFYFITWINNNIVN